MSRSIGETPIVYRLHEDAVGVALARSQYGDLSACSHTARTDSEPPFLCALHVAEGVMCSSCWETHNGSHDITQAWRCMECDRADVLVTFPCFELSSTGLLVTYPDGSQARLVGMIWLAGLSVCTECRGD